jgi:hypothetical protein
MLILVFCFYLQKVYYFKSNKIFMFISHYFKTIALRNLLSYLIFLSQNFNFTEFMAHVKLICSYVCHDGIDEEDGYISTHKHQH